MPIPQLMDAPGGFAAFLENFVQQGEYYIPKNQGCNEYRHCGMKKDKVLYLSLDDVRFLYSKTPPEACSLRTRAYYELRHMGLNIIKNPQDESISVYERKKHFRRDLAEPLGRLVFAGRDDIFEANQENTIMCVTSDDAYCFIKVEPIDKLSFTIDRKLYKQ